MMVNEVDDNWLEEESEGADDFIVTEYDITSSPNDFNIKTIFDFIESGVVKIPGFQRNYVWDIKTASKLIESIIIGLPIPQIFLYEHSRNKFLVIDGQQRLLSIYYFIKQRFPKKEKRTELRKILEDNGKIPEKILHDDNYFTNFKLKLNEDEPNQQNKFNKVNYLTLGDYQSSFDLRTIRTIIIKQNQPANDSSSIFEIFNRLNSGGYNLKPQEIRASLFHSDFFDMLGRINYDTRWRKTIGQENPDLHMKDVEIMLRGFAMLLEGNSYRPSMTKFLNSFCRKSQNFELNFVNYLQELFYSFMESCEKLDYRPFYGKSGKFNISVYEAVFAAFCKPAFEKHELLEIKIDPDKLDALKETQEFINATQHSTASKEHVTERIALAERMLVL